MVDIQYTILQFISMYAILYIVLFTQHNEFFSDFDFISSKSMHFINCNSETESIKTFFVKIKLELIVTKIAVNGFIIQMHYSF